MRISDWSSDVFSSDLALHFTAEVGVARGVDDVDAVVLPANGGVLGQDGNAALALLIVGIHDAFDVAGAFAERAGLLQQTIHQSGVAIDRQRVVYGQGGSVGVGTGGRR